MKIVKNKVFTNFIIIGFLATFTFGCAMGAQMLINKSQHANMTQAECCDVGIGAYDTNFGMTHNLPYILSTANFLTIVLLVVTSFVIILSSRFTNFISGNYYRSVRDKYGGFRFFDKLIFLFSQGIIHPKIY